jgi:hypothetical protein
MSYKLSFHGRILLQSLVCAPFSLSASTGFDAGCRVSMWGQT